VTVPTLADPSLAPPGEHLLVLTALVPYTAVRVWRAEKDASAAIRSPFPDT